MPQLIHNLDDKETLKDLKAELARLNALVLVQVLNPAQAISVSN